MSTRTKLELLVGPIASGKSIYALRRAEEGALIVSHDRLTEMLHGEYRYEKTPEMRALYRAMEAELVGLALSAGREVVIDRTHLTRESRARWIDFARVRAVPIVAVVFPDLGPEEHADRRYWSDSRGRSYSEWLAVARHHAEQAAAEPLDLSEGFDAIVPGVGP